MHIIIQDSGHRYFVPDGIQFEAAKLIAMTRMDRKNAGILPACQLRLATETGSHALVGCGSNGTTTIAPSPRDGGISLIHGAKDLTAL